VSAIRDDDGAAGVEPAFSDRHPPETKFFFSFFGHSRRQQLRHLARLNADLGIELPPPAARIQSLADGRAFYESMARRYVDRLQKKRVAWFGEKTPEHTGHLARIRQMFPRAKIIVLCRDGRDVALSLTKVPWMSSNLYVNFVVWLYYSRIVREALLRAGPNLYFARYEDIVADPEEQLGRMLRFLELPFEPAVARGYGNKEGVPEREYAWKARALEAISTARVGLFQRELGAAQLEVLERLGGSTLQSLGYRLTTDGKAGLPLNLLLSLSLDTVKLVWRLPWQSVLNEFLGRVFSRRSDDALPLSSCPPAPA